LRQHNAAWALPAQAQMSSPLSVVERLDNDRGFPTAPAFLRLAEALGVRPERLAEGVDDPAEDEPEPAREKPRRALKGRRRRQDTGTGR
jgi:hypothetical protein